MKHGRLIDADALIEKLEAWKKEAERRDANINYAFASAIIAQVNAEPTIEERKVGKWIEESQYVDKWGDTIEILKCPICGFKHDYCQGDTGLDDKTWFNYCPNCGADMR